MKEDDGGQTDRGGKMFDEEGEIMIKKRRGNENISKELQG